MEVGAVNKGLELVIFLNLLSIIIFVEASFQFFEFLFNSQSLGFLFLLIDKASIY